MPLPRPSSFLNWTVGNPNFGTVTVEPDSGKKITGWTPGEPPPNQFFNWLFYQLDQWVQYLDSLGASLVVSNVGHNIITDTTLQGQLDQIDAFLSSLALQHLTMTATGNPSVYTISPLPLNGAMPIIFLDGIDEEPTAEFTYAVVAGVGTVSFLTAPSTGQVPQAWALTANNPGVGGSAANGGYVAYGSAVSGQLITAVGGISSTVDQRALIFTVSAGGAVAVTANPQVTVGTKVGQELRLVGTSNTDYITLANGNGLLLNGPILLKSGTSIDLYWNGSVWAESDRNS